MKYKYNEGGRGEHYKGLSGDCVTRAITIATEQRYDDVYNALFDIARNWKGNSKLAKRIRTNASPRDGCFKEVGSKYLKDLSIDEVRKKLKINDQIFNEGRYVVKVRRHWIAIIDGVVHDTWDSRKTSGAYTDGVPQWKTVTRYWKVIRETV